MRTPVTKSATAGQRRRYELIVFLVLTLLLTPALAVITVGGYGLGVWIYQMIAGPPGPPPDHEPGVVYNPNLGEAADAVFAPSGCIVDSGTRPPRGMPLQPVGSKSSA